MFKEGAVMNIIMGFILFACTVTTLVAVFTNIALWIGLGFLIICALSIWEERRMDDPSGDGGIAIFFAIIAPSFILGITFLIAAGIKYLVMRLL
jgi:hypothetical protein